MVAANFSSIVQFVLKKVHLFKGYPSLFKSFAWQKRFANLKGFWVCLQFVFNLKKRIFVKKTANVFVFCVQVCKCKISFRPTLLSFLCHFHLLAMNSKCRGKKRAICRFASSLTSVGIWKLSSQNIF